MSDLTDRIAAEHPGLIHGTPGTACRGCLTPIHAAEDGAFNASYSRHLADEVEKAVRTQIATDLRATDPVDWALLGQDAGEFAVNFVLTGSDPL